MIRVDNLVKQFGDVRAVDGLSFELFPGEILGFLGPNGAGKTTTMRVLTCFFPPTSGSANVAGFDVLNEPDEVRRVIGYMPEGVPLYKEMPVTDYLDFIAHAKGYGRSDRKKYVASAIEETNLGEVRNRIVGQLSKGFRQRVGLAQAIIGDPKVLILDEPTSGLDPRQIADMRALIKRMAGERTVILSTHILPEVQMTCSRVIIINKGKIAASGTPEKLTSRIQNRFTTVASIVGPEDSVVKALKDLSGVLEVTPSSADEKNLAEVRGVTGRARDYTITSGIESPDVRPAIVSCVVKNNWPMVELREIGISLEDVFLQVVAGEPIDVPMSSMPGKVATVKAKPAPVEPIEQKISEPVVSESAEDKPSKEKPSEEKPSGEKKGKAV